MTQIYVVFGDTGQYDDYVEWPVRAFTTEVGATAFVSLLTTLVAANAASKPRYQGSGYGQQWRQWVENSGQGFPDPGFNWEDGGLPHYTIKKVDFVAA